MSFNDERIKGMLDNRIAALMSEIGQNRWTGGQDMKILLERRSQ